MINSAYKSGDYDWLYANYLPAKQDRLAKLVAQTIERNDPEIAIDLCAGTGYMTKKLSDARVPNILAVDGSPQMLQSLGNKLGPLDNLRCKIWGLDMDLNESGALSHVRRSLDPFKGADLIVCRQGVGYLTPETLAQIPQLLNPGGSFLFNAFMKPTRLRFRRSKNGIVEAGVFAFGKVFHLQGRWPELEERLPQVDLTSFRWHDINGFFSPLWNKLGFGVDIKIVGRSIICEVVRRPEADDLH